MSRIKWKQGRGRLYPEGIRGLDIEKKLVLKRGKLGLSSIKEGIKPSLFTTASQLQEIHSYRAQLIHPIKMKNFLALCLLFAAANAFSLGEI